MVLQKTWFEKLDSLAAEQCLPLGDASQQSVYSAIRDNRTKLGDRKFRIQTDRKTKKQHVCRVK